MSSALKLTLAHYEKCSAWNSSTKKVRAGEQARKNKRLLIHAIHFNNLDAIARLVRGGAICSFGVNASALRYAISLNNVEAIRLLLDNNAYVDLDCLLSVTPETARVFYEHVDVKYTRSSAAVLQMAIGRNDMDGVRCLMERGANGNGRRAALEMFTPLHNAVQTANVVCVELLLRYGANPNRSDALDRTALDFLMFSTKTEYYLEHFEDFEQIVDLLLDAGSDINKCLFKGFKLLVGPARLRSIDRKNIIEKLEILLKRMAKLERKEIEISRANSDSLMSNRKLKRFYTACRNEIRQIQKVKIFGKLSLLDFLLESARTMSPYASDTNRTMLESCAEEFPLYHGQLMKQMNSATHRKKTEETAGATIELLSNNAIDKVHIATRKILQMLSMDDLNSLISATSI